MAGRTRAQMASQLKASKVSAAKRRGTGASKELKAIYVRKLGEARARGDDHGIREYEAKLGGAVSHTGGVVQPPLNMRTIRRNR